MSPRDLIIGIDAGTSVIKAVVFTTDGTQVAMAARPNSYATPGPGHVEQDMLRTWDDCAATLRELHDAVPGLSDRVVALAVTGQGDGTWLIDADGNPVGGGLLWLDSRAAALCAEHVQHPGYADHYASTGAGLTACMSSGQIAWMKRFQPERIARATTAFHCKDFLYFKLTGERVTDPCEATFTFGNYRTRRYEPLILDHLGIRDCERLLPPIQDGVAGHHSLTPTAAAMTGLPEGLPVVLAYLDVACTAIGGGLIDTDVDVGLSVVGSTGMHMTFVPSADQVTLNASRSGYTLVMPIGTACAITQSNMAATLNVDWLVDLACEATGLTGTRVSRSAMLKALDAAVPDAAPGSAIYHPYILEAGERGPFVDPTARAQFSGLSSRTTLPGLMRAVYEGLAFAARDCYLASGAIPSEVRMGGGAARSQALRSILASVLGTPVRTVSRDEAGAAGAAMMAAVGLGIYPDIPTCAQTWVRPFLGDATQPDPPLTERYARLFPIYQTIRKAMPPAWAALAGATEVRS